MTEPFVVTALGSCRIVNPMRLAAQAGRLRLANAGVYGYVHTGREVAQLLDRRAGAEPAAELAPYLTGARSLPPRAPAERPTAYLVEISSLKNVLFGGWSLQLNYFAERFRHARELLEAFYEDPGEEGRDRRALALSRLPAFAACEPFDRRVLVDAYLTTTTRDELEADCRAVLARLDAPAVLVTHVDVPDPSGRRIEARSCLSEWLPAIGAALGVPVFDPTPQVLWFGADKALVDRQSRSHYAPDFEAYLSDRLESELRDAVAQRAPDAAAAGTAPPIRRDALPPDDLALRPDEACGRAAERLRAGDPAGARASARAAIAIDPAGELAPTILAQAALREGAPLQALDLARLILRRDPNHPGAIAISAKASTKLHRFDEAAHLWLQLAVGRPAAARPVVEAARCRLRSKRPQEALELSDEALRRQPGDLLALALRAEALQALGRFDELPAMAEALAGPAPGAAVAIMRWLLAAGRLEGIPAAASALGPLAPDEPDDGRDELRVLLRSAAEDAVSAERWTTAGWALRAVLALDPGDVGARRTVVEMVKARIADARTALAAGDLEGAAAAYEVALAIHPEHERALREAASLAEKRGDRDGAAALLSRLASSPDADAATLAKAARAHELAGRDEEALALYGRVLAALPTDGKAAAAARAILRRLAKRARRLEADGDLREAARLAHVVVERDPGDPICTRLLRRSGGALARRLKLAVARADEGEQEAIAADLLQVDADRFEALRVLSRSRLRSGRLHEAADLLRRLTVVQADQAAHWVKLGRCLRMMKSYGEARAAAETALACDPTNLAARKILEDVGGRASA